MLDKIKRIVPHHSRTCKPHDITYLLSHFGLVAMYPAIGASCFTFSKRAIIKPFGGILQNQFAVGAQHLASVFFTTIKPYHSLNSEFLTG
jgi:hypothetical protein